jgi:thiamine monophosphate synthase
VLPKHVPRLRGVGVHGAAVIRGIWEAENAERAATDYLSAHDAPGPT